MRKLGLLFLILIFILQGCSGQSSSTAKSDDQTLIIGIESEADVLDPHRAGGWVTYRVNSQIHEQLLTEDLSESAKKKLFPQ